MVNFNDTTLGPYDTLEQKKRGSSSTMMATILATALSANAPLCAVDSSSDDVKKAIISTAIEFSSNSNFYISQVSRIQKKSYREGYSKIIQREAFKKAYVGKSVGESIAFEDL